MSIESKTVEARQKQREASKTATLDLLKSKKRARETFSLFLLDEDGEQQEVQMTFQSIGARAYDKLVSKHPPKADERVEGASFHLDTFAPALIAACAVDPEMTPQDATEIWESEDWSRGDLMVLFTKAVSINNRGIDIPFNVTG